MSDWNPSVLGFIILLFNRKMRARNHKTKKQYNDRLYIHARKGS